MTKARFLDHPFTTEMALATGASKRDLAVGVRQRQLRRPFHGVYVPYDWPDDPLHRAESAALVLNKGQVFVDRTAAWIHGVDVFALAEAETVPRVEAAVLTRLRASRAGGVRGRSRDLAPRDLVELGRVRLTSPLRTALDLACNLRRAEALGCLDAFARLHGVTQGDLQAGLVRFRGRRGVVQARALVPILDPRSESMRESQLRLAILDAGLPSPTPQYVVDLDGYWFRLDLAYPAHRLAVEYDGVEFHHSPEQREHDDMRRALMAEAGWTFVVVRLGDFTGERLDRWISDLRGHLGHAYSTLRW